MKRRFDTRRVLSAIAIGAFGCTIVATTEVPSSQSLSPQTTFAPVRDPGVRGGPAAAGGPLPGLSVNELAFFNKGLDEFSEADEVDEGLGPRMNLDSCAGCHAQPAIGGSSPLTNPQFEFATRG